MTTATLRETLRDISQYVTEGLPRKWTEKQFQEALIAKTKRLDLNNFHEEIVERFVRAEVADRAKVQPFVLDEDGHVQPELFTEEAARRGIIRLGDGLRVLMREALYEEWVAHAGQQAIAAHRAAEASVRTHGWLATPAGILLSQNHGMKTYQAMKQLKWW